MISVYYKSIKRNAADNFRQKKERERGREREDMNNARPPPRLFFNGRFRGLIGKQYSETFINVME